MASLDEHELVIFI